MMPSSTPDPRDPRDPRDAAADADALAALRRRFVAAQLAGERRGALRLVLDEGVDAGHSPADLLLRVITPAQHEIGRLWQENRISVAREHLATAIAQLALANLYARLPDAPRRHRHALVACAPGERHDLGARIAADFLEMDGFDVTFLGADVPSDGLVEAVRRVRPDALVLSAATSLCFADLGEAVARVHDAAPALPVLVGGRAFDDADAAPVPADVLYAGRDAAQLVAALREATGVATAGPADSATP